MALNGAPRSLFIARRRYAGISFTDEIAIVLGFFSMSSIVLIGEACQKNRTDVVSSSRPSARNLRASYLICGLSNNCSLAKDEVMMASVAPSCGATLYR